MTPSVADLRRGIAIGAGLWVAFEPTATDEEIRELCRTAYSWETVHIERDAAIARARPLAIEKLRKVHPEQKAVDAASADLLLKTNPRGS